MLDFVDYFRGREVLILIDALASGGEPGQLLTFDKEQLRQFHTNMGLSAHQPCLFETLYAAETAGIELKEVLLVGGARQLRRRDQARLLCTRLHARSAGLVVEFIRRHGVNVEERATALAMRPVVGI